MRKYQEVLFLFRVFVYGVLMVFVGNCDGRTIRYALRRICDAGVVNALPIPVLFLRPDKVVKCDLHGKSVAPVCFVFGIFRRQLRFQQHGVNMQNK